jgi:RHS repeat-associated protein
MIKYTLTRRRVAKKVGAGNWRWYFYDGLKVVAEGTGTSDKIHYTNSPGAIGGIISRDNNGTKYWYHYDRLGNVMAVTDSNGNLYAGYTMEAFGNVLEIGTATGYYSTQSDPQPYHLTTKELDPDSGLYYFNARWYDSLVGRFVSWDSVFRGKAPADCATGWFYSSNPYSFVDNSPPNTVDEDGNFPWIRVVTTLIACGIAAWTAKNIADCFKSCKLLQETIERNRQRLLEGNPNFLCEQDKYARGMCFKECLIPYEKDILSIAAMAHCAWQVARTLGALWGAAGHVGTRAAGRG